MKRLFSVLPSALLSVLLSFIFSWQIFANTQGIGKIDTVATDSMLSELVNKLPATKLKRKLAMTELVIYYLR